MEDETPEEELTVFCSICLETEDVYTRRVTLPCQHVFHMHCIEEYLDYKDEDTLKCPICRTGLPSHILHSVFDIAHTDEHAHKDVRIIVRDAPNVDEIITTTTNEHPSQNQHQGCRRGDLFVITVLLIGLTIYLLALYKVI